MLLCLSNQFQPLSQSWPDCVCGRCEWGAPSSAGTMVHNTIVVSDHPFGESNKIIFGGRIVGRHLNSMVVLGWYRRL